MICLTPIKVINDTDANMVVEEAQKAIAFLERLGGHNDAALNGNMLKKSMLVYYIDVEGNIKVTRIEEYRGLQEPQPLSYYIDNIQAKDPICGYYLSKDGEILRKDAKSSPCASSITFRSEAQAKSAKAYAQITQMMDCYGETVEDDEWRYLDSPKYVVKRVGDMLRVVPEYVDYHHIAFKEKAAAEWFLADNRSLCETFFMIEE